MNTNLFLENALRNAPQQVGLICGEQKYTYEEIFDNVNRLTNALLQIGCHAGCRVAILARNCTESVILYYACARINAVYVPLNYRESPENLINMVHLVEPEYFFVDNDNLNSCISIHHQLPTVKYYISLNKPHAHYLYYKLLLEHASDEYYCYANSDNDPTAILFTSGTTHMRKAVAFSHINFIHHVMNAEARFPQEIDHVSLVCIPFYHILGFQSITSAIYYCHPLVLIRAFEPESVLKIIEQEKITQTFLPTSKLSAILQCPKLQETDLSSLDNIKYGCDISYAPLALEALEKLPSHVKLQNIYGLTEATYDVAVLDQEDHNLNVTGKERAQKLIRLNSIGKPLGSIRLIIADEKEHELPCGEIGELLIHTQRRMIGYVSPVTHKIEENNAYWLHTNDIGYCDEDGYIFMLGQKVTTLANQNLKHSPILSPNFTVFPCVDSDAAEVAEENPEIDRLRPFINQNTYFSFLRYMRQLYESRSIQELTDKYLQSISKFIPASSFGIHLITDQSEPLKQLQMTSDNPLKWDMPYFDTLPLYAASAKVENQKKELFAQPLSQFISLQDYIETLQPDHLICTPLYSSSRKLMGILSFGRVGTNWDFNQYEQNLILMISSHMCTALANQLEHDALVQQKTLLENIISVSGTPVVVTDAEGTLIYENQYAHIILERDFLGNHENTIYQAILDNTASLISTGNRQISRPVEATFLYEKLGYIVKTIVSDTDFPTYITTINESESLPDFSFLESTLTPQEIHILTLIAQGYSNAGIADTLVISVNTVKYHLKNLFRKLEVSSRTELLTKVYAMNRNIKKL